MCKCQKFTAKSNGPFGVNGMDDLGLHCSEATLVCIVFNDKLFVFCNLVQPVNFNGSDCG